MSVSFGAYFNPTKSTSGQRFFEDLCRTLSVEALPLDERPAAVLFNVSAPIGEIIKAKGRGQKILLRIDGMYFDRLSAPFVASFRWPLRTMFAIGRRWRAAHDPLAFVANLLDKNYGSFARILLADHLIYQSDFSQQVHARYFPDKPYDIVVNGSIYRGSKRPTRDAAKGRDIRLVTTYDDWKPAKRVHDVLAFVKWAREIKGVPLQLTVLGYSGRVPAAAPSDMRDLLEMAPYIVTLPRFQKYDGAVRDALFAADLYITFTHRDPCPNTVVEAMAHGLPVVGIASGGMPDIVRDAGILVPVDDAEPFYTSFRHEGDFPRIDFEKVLEAVLMVSSQRDAFETRVARRFATDLGIEIVAEQYATALRALGKA